MPAASGIRVRSVRNGQDPDEQNRVVFRLVLFTSNPCSPTRICICDFCPRHARTIIRVMFFRRVRGCHHPILTGLSTKYLLGISSRTTIRCIADKYCKNYLNDQMWNQEDFNYRLRERPDGDLHRSVLCVARVIEDEFDRCMCLRSVLC